MKNVITIILIVVCVAVLCFSGYQLLKYYGANRAAEKDFEELLPPEMVSADVADAEDEETGQKIGYEELLPYYEDLREQNSDMVGWLRIPGTDITYPVMQTKQNEEYYLSRDFKKEYSANGSLFASAASDVDVPSDAVIVYGHRMKSGSMFGKLGDYLDADFMSEHKSVVFDTFSERNKYNVYCVFSEEVGTENDFEYYNYHTFADETSFNGFMAQVKGLMQMSNPENEPIYGDKILLLSTCEYTHENGRLVVVAVRS